MTEVQRDRLEWIEGDMPFSTSFGDHFYARNDGRAECAEVFMGGNDLPARLKETGGFTIAELGFGTGLNFLETWRQWQQFRMSDGQLEFASFEAFPMKPEVINRAISAWPDLEPLALKLASVMSHIKPGAQQFQMDDRTVLTLVIADATKGLSTWQGRADAWYLDGFAPSKNPQMWSAELMTLVFDRTSSGGTFSTYTAAGWVRRNLEDAGFEVQKVPGFFGKRERLEGTKPLSAAQ